MSLPATYPGYLVIAEDPQNIMFGTVQVGDDFGQAKSATVKRTADKEELVANSGNLRAVILKNPRFELDLETLFTLDVEPPGIGERIMFPLVDVIGHILDVEVQWEDSKGRGLKITATSWDVFGGNATAQHYDGTTWTPIVDTVPLEGASPPTLTTAIISASGLLLTLVFSESVTCPVVGNLVTLAASVTGAVQGVYASGSGTNTIVCNLSAEVQDADVVTLDYTQPGNGIQNLTGIDLVTINDAAVTNNSTQV
jgi:hypothetical protein